jgi:myo-inositol-1(or 4)-monophosphatase
VTDYLKLCEQAARAGAEVIASWVGRFGVREKGPSDLVTEADGAAQEAIRQIIASACPDHQFVGEELDEPVRFDSPFCWVVDPLDGTTNYVHGVPHYAVSVALVERGRPLVGVVFDPVADECFAAQRGQGARLNGKPIRASQVQQLAEALVAASFSSHVTFPSPEVDQFVAALQRCQAVRRTGSAALNLCYVASGRFDAFWAQSTKAWDIAAGILLVEEAGGVVTDLQGESIDLDFPFPVASATPSLHRQFCELLKSAARLG